MQRPPLIANNILQFSRHAERALFYNRCFCSCANSTMEKALRSRILIIPWQRDYGNYTPTGSLRYRCMKIIKRALKLHFKMLVYTRLNISITKYTTSEI